MEINGMASHEINTDMPFETAGFVSAPIHETIQWRPNEGNDLFQNNDFREKTNARGRNERENKICGQLGKIEINRI